MAGQFTASNTGRPKGSRNKATFAIERLLQGQGEALTKTAVKKASEGDGIALRLCMERIAPAPKPHPTLVRSHQPAVSSGALRQVYRHR